MKDYENAKLLSIYRRGWSETSDEKLLELFSRARKRRDRYPRAWKEWERWEAVVRAACDELIERHLAATV